MHCPFCEADDTRVSDSRLASDGQQVKRRRACTVCGERFTTFERAELVMPWVIKRDGSREAFSEEKIRAGMMQALQKRPVSTDAIDEALAKILKRVRALGEREVSCDWIGECVIELLHDLDPVAYVRFASVYRSFEDIEAFREEVERLHKNGRRRKRQQKISLVQTPKQKQ